MNRGIGYYIFIFLIMVFMGFWIGTGIKDNDRTQIKRETCHQKGGVIVDGICIKAEQIKD